MPRPRRAPAMNPDANVRARPALLALGVDAVCVVVFCALGRRSHAEGLDVAGIAQTAWPFLTGAATGWLGARGWRRPTALVPTGVVVWAATVAVGMLLRGVLHAGVAASFVCVATAVTAVLLLGWRGLVVLARR